MKFCKESAPKRKRIKKFDQKKSVKEKHEAKRKES